MTSQVPAIFHVESLLRNVKERNQIKQRSFRCFRCVNLRPSLPLWCLGSFKILECVPRLCQLSSEGLSRGSGSCLGISKAGVQEGAVLRKPLRHVRQPHHLPAHRCACAPEPPHLRPGQPGDPERTGVQAGPHPGRAAVPRMQQPAGVQDLTDLLPSHPRPFEKDREDQSLDRGFFHGHSSASVIIITFERKKNKSVPQFKLSVDDKTAFLILKQRKGIYFN